MSRRAFAWENQNKHNDALFHAQLVGLPRNLCGGHGRCLSRSLVKITKQSNRNAEELLYQSMDAQRNTWKPTRITLGTTYRDGTGQGAVNFSTARVYIHEDFEPVTLCNDISLLKLPKAVGENGYIRKAVLPLSGTIVQERKSCIATGWGATESDGGITSIAEDLQEVDVKIYSDDECVKLSSAVDGKNQVCAGHVQGGKDTCRGDSGGPLMCPEGGDYVIRGITSHGPWECGSPNQPGVYTRVSTFLKWIDDTMQGYHWKLGIKSGCSVTCGKGIERQTRTCHDQHDKLVSNSKCHGASSHLLECIKPKCETYDWSSWKTTCGVTCGDGKSIRTRKCLNGKNNHEVENSNCGFGKTFEVGRCSRPVCQEYHWKLGVKGECSVTCGKGTERQPRTCRDQHEKIVSYSNCDGASTLLFECIKPDCETYKWSQWKSTCSVTCGKGKAILTRECLSTRNNQKVATFNCGFGKTSKISGCNRPRCPEYHWKLGIRRKCSVTCGKGIEKRTRTCRDQNNKLVSTTNCDGDSILVYECVKPECETFEWGPWKSICSVTCGSGKATRTRECLTEKNNQKVENFNCGSGKTFEIRRCNRPSCPVYHWNIVDAVCTVTCGKGIETRNLVCSDQYGKRVSPTNCKGESVLYGECFRGECEKSSWGPWQAYCTVTCGTGLRIKVRECYDERTKAESKLCKTGSTHQVDGFCNNMPCTSEDSRFRWDQWSSWSSCRVALTSLVCNGFRSATRDCLHGTKEVDPQKCRTTTRPADDYYREEDCVPRNCGSG